MNKNLIRLCVSVVFLGSLAGCGQADRAEIVVQEDDNGGDIELDVGDTFQVVLSGNPTTGYSWESLPGQSDIVLQIGEAVYQAQSTLVGSGGEFTFRYQAMKPGSTRLNWIYHRPWEEGVSPLETFEIEVRVH